MAWPERLVEGLKTSETDISLSVMPPCVILVSTRWVDVYSGAPGGNANEEVEWKSIVSGALQMISDPIGGLRYYASHNENDMMEGRMDET